MDAITINQGYSQKYVEVLGLKVLSDYDDIGVILNIANFAKRIFETVELRWSEVNIHSISKLLMKKGVPVTDFKVIFKDIQKQVSRRLYEGRVMEEEEHASLGWFEIDGDLVFKANAVYTADGVKPSNYAGSYDIQSSGNLAAFVDMLIKCVVGNTELSAICSMAAAATVLPYANDVWKTSFYNAICHLVGNSSTGKSTAAYLFVALGSSPEGVGAMMLSFLATPNALVQQIGGNQGYPCAIDEFSTGGGKKFWSDFVYTLANGLGKARCCAGGSKVSQASTFSTVFLTTGEAGILSRCNKNEGVRARLFEFNVDSWTRSADESNYIKKICKANFGFVTPLIAQELLANGDIWYEHFRDWRHIIKAQIAEDKLILGIGDRITDVVALFMVSCEIVNSVLRICLDVEGVFDFFYEHIIFKNAEDANLGIRAHDAILRHFVRYKDRFVDEFDACWMGVEGFVVPPDKEGIRVCLSDKQRSHKGADGKDYRDYIVFYPDALETILTNAGFSDVRVAMKAMHKEKLLKTKDASRETYDVTFDGVKIPAYIVWFDDTNY